MHFGLSNINQTSYFFPFIDNFVSFQGFSFGAMYRVSITRKKKEQEDETRDISLYQVSYQFILAKFLPIPQELETYQEVCYNKQVKQNNKTCFCLNL